KKMNVNDDTKYAVPPRALRKYIDEYVDRKYQEKFGGIPVTDGEKNKILYREGATKGQKYKQNDIFRMLDDRKVFKKIERRVHLKSFYILTDEDIEIYIPDSIWYAYLKDPANSSNKEVQQYHKKLRKMKSIELNKELESLKEKQLIIEKELEDRKLLINEILDFRDKFKDKLDKKDDVPIVLEIPQESIKVQDVTVVTNNDE